MSEQDLGDLSRNAQGLLLLGEIRGQLRELIHTSNGNSSKLDALGLRVSKLEMQASRVDALEALGPKLAKLEEHQSRREGATGVVQAIVKSPMVGWLVGGATFLWGILTGRIHL